MFQSLHSKFYIYIFTIFFLFSKNIKKNQGKKLFYKVWHVFYFKPETVGCLWWCIHTNFVTEENLHKKCQKKTNIEPNVKELFQHLQMCQKVPQEVLTGFNVLNILTCHIKV